MTTLPDWLDRDEYPFTPRRFETADGAMSYVDIGEGRPIVFVHGTPTWSFLYRRFIREFSRDHRCVAPDHLGFGLSDKPEGAPYRPADHARRLAALLDTMRLRDITLVVHDFGGPIGLSFALEHPDRVRNLVVFNTWMWSTRRDVRTRLLVAMLGSPLGRWLYLERNFAAASVLRAAFADKSKLTPATYRHYTSVAASPRERIAQFALVRELVDSSGWYDDLWRRVEAIQHKPALLLWGMKDIAFRPRDLARWRSALTNSRIAQFANAGHFVQEEAPESAIAVMREMIDRT
ncbi:MAG: alpha/beta fold hydrolase [Deltaproteobacteria bacterium]|nr:alpha/beta fold hydrolase [Deltaproteobacteria bacterium]